MHFPFTVATHPKWQTDFQLHLTLDEAKAFADRLEALLQGSPQVTFSPHLLRSRDPQYTDQWTLYWKIKTPGPARVMVAHPEHHEWVATIALEHVQMERLIQELRNGNSISLDTLGSSHFLNNLQLSFHL